VLVVDPTISSVIAITSLALVSACSVTDILSRRIPNQFLVTALALALICHGYDSGAIGLIKSTLGLFIGMAMLMPFYLLGGTGAGDVKLLGVVGALLGAQGVLVAGAATFVCGGLLGGAWILWRIIDAYFKAQFLSYTQLKSVGLFPMIGLMPQVKIRGTSFPYAPAIASGTYIAIWYFDLLRPAAGQ